MREFGCDTRLSNGKDCGSYVLEEWGSYQCLCQECHEKRSQYEKTLKLQDQLSEEKRLRTEDHKKAVKSIMWLVGLLIVSLGLLIATNT